MNETMLSVNSEQNVEKTRRACHDGGGPDSDRRRHPGCRGRGGKYLKASHAVIKRSKYVRKAVAPASRSINGPVDQQTDQPINRPGAAGRRRHGA